MALPAGITTCTVTFGSALTFLAKGASVSITIEPSHYVVWTATGSPLIPIDETVTGPNAVEVDLPHVDQTGFVDSSGAPVTNWGYKTTVTYTSNRHDYTISRYIQPLVGQSIIDFDLIPIGVPIQAIVGDQTWVTSVGGATGTVTSEQLATILNPYLTSPPVASSDITDATPTGINLLTATDATAARTAISAKDAAYIPTWTEVTGKPLTFPPVIGTTATDAKPGNYTPTWTEVTGKPLTFPPVVGTTATDAKPGNYTPTWTEVTGKPTTFPPSAHTHTAADLSGVVKTINSNPPDAAGNINITVGSGSSPQTLREVLIGEDINAALSGYEGEVRLQRGTHDTTVPIIQNRRQKVVGEGGGATIIRATAAITGGLWRIGNGGPADKTHLSDITLAANNLATYGLDMNIVGTTGNYGGEPDGQAHIERLFIDDATDIGVYTRGGDSQAYHLNSLRVRRAGNYGFRIDVGGPDAWIRDCEATTSNTGTGAGFLVGSSNLHFSDCKAWYCRGYGWDIKGTRNLFTGCESQDTRLHGWFIEWDKNQYVNCMADSAGYADVGGTSNTQDGFYLASGLIHTMMNGCVAFDREQGFPANMRYGFNMSASTYNIGRSTLATTAAAGNTTTPVMIGALSGGAIGEANYKVLSGLLNLR